VEGLHEAGVSDEIIIAIQMDLSSVEIPRKDKSLLLLAEDLTLDPAIGAGAVQDAVDAGWSNEEIAHAIFLVSYFNMATRIVEAFNLPPDEYHQFDPDGSLPLLYEE
jgi:hypothetical protein